MSDTSIVHVSLGVLLFPWYISLCQHSFKLCTTFCPGGFSFSHMVLKLDFPIFLSISSSLLQSLVQRHCKYALSFYSDLKGTDLGTPALLAQGEAMNFSTGNNDKDKHVNVHTSENKWERFKENLTEHLKPQQTWKKPAASSQEDKFTWCRNYLCVFHSFVTTVNPSALSVYWVQEPFTSQIFVFYNCLIKLGK